MTEPELPSGARPSEVPTRKVRPEPEDVTIAPGAATPVETFLSLLAKSKLLGEQQEVEFRQMSADAKDDPSLARELVERGWLTSWQAERLLAGYGVFHLGKYLLLAKLGEGGMGEVYKARQGVTGRIVALKVMSPELFDDPDSVARFRQEVRAAAALHHPNIVTTFDADCAGKNHFLVMEYVEGRDLSDWIAEHRRLPFAWASECARQAALGLQHAHEKGLVHRDLKPANLIVIGKDFTAPPVVKILDMGLARFERTEEKLDLTTTSEVFGTPHYMAPEQAKSARLADIRSDIFSLGGTLFKMLTGENPYEGNMLSEQIAARFAGPARRVAEFAPEVPSELSEIVAKCLAQRPEDRYQTPQEMAQALARFLSGQKRRPASAEKPPEAKAAAAPRDNRPLLAGVALAAVLVVGLGIWFATRPKGDSIVKKDRETTQTPVKTTVAPVKGTTDPPVKGSTGLTTAELLASPDYEWSAPLNLGAAINSGLRNLNVTLTSDERFMVFSRDGKLWSSRRASADEPFTKAELLPDSINQQAGEATSLTGDGLLLAISSTRAGSAADDIWVSERKTMDEPFGDPVRLPEPVNSATSERVPYFSVDGLTLIVTTIRRGGVGHGHLVMYTRAARDKPFGNETLLPQPISSQFYNSADWLSGDGLVIATTRMGTPPFQTRYFTRPTRDAPFGPEQLFGPQLDKINPGRPWLSPDGKRMYFHSREITPRHGDLNLWMSERVKR